MANWEAKRIIDVVDEIEEGTYVLPVIQRDFVWKEEQISDLFDSIMKGYSFGGIIVIEEDKGSKPLFEFRTFASTNETKESSPVSILDKKQYFVIDGQQRLQSLYIGLKGDIDNKKLFFNLLSNPKEEYEFDFFLDKERIESVKDADKNVKKFWVPIKSLIEKVKKTKHKMITNELTNGFQVNEEEKDLIDNNIEAFADSFNNDKTLGIATMVIDKVSFCDRENRQKVVESFKRLNNGGTKLNALDLVASELKGYAYDMERFIKDIDSKYSSFGLDAENLLKFCYIVQDKNPKDAFNLQEQDALYIITNRDKIEACIYALDKFLDFSRLKAYYTNFSSSFVPLFFVMYHLYHKCIAINDIKSYFDNLETGNDDYNLMVKMIKLSILCGTFKSKGAGWTPYTTGVNLMLKEAKTHKNSEFPYKEYIELFRSKTKFFDENIKGEYLSLYNNDFTFYLMYGMSVIPRKNDIDHIMPKNILLNLQFNIDEINDIRNYQLLDYGTNRGEKNGKPLKAWIDNYVTDIETYKKMHLIPDDNNDLLKEENYLRFKSEREKMIIEKIKDEV